MRDFFPLYFNQQKARYTRGLSSEDAEKIKDLKHIYSNPIHVPERDPRYKITIVWDLDQTLVSADGIDDENERDPTIKLVIRPRAYDVLRAIRRNDDVEFIIWTAGSPDHAKRVVLSFPDIRFDHIIARHKCWYKEDNPTKDLRKIVNSSRPLSSIILVDDRMDIGREHPENLLIVPGYYPKKSHGDNDATLLYLANVLQRAINMYRLDNTHPLYSYLYSPLTVKCVWKNHHYYGIKCFKNIDELRERIKNFS